MIIFKLVRTSQLVQDLKWRWERVSVSMKDSTLKKIQKSRNVFLSSKQIQKYINYHESKFVE
jgi:hypothetical protein